MPQPDQSAVHVNRPLTNMAMMYVQDEGAFVSDKIFPNIPSKNQSDIYFIYPKGHFARDAMVKRAPGTESAGIGFDVTTSSYLCTNFSLHHDVADEVRANQDSPLDMDRDAAIQVTQAALIRREREFATKFMTTGVWATDVTGVSGTPSGNQVKQWNDSASTPLKDITKWTTEVQKATGRRPRGLGIGRLVWDQLKNHPEILDRVNAGQTPGKPAEVTKEIVARLMELNELHVFDGVYNTAIEGAADSFDFIVGKVGLLYFKPPQNAPSIVVPSAGYTFSWTGLHGATEMGYRIKKFRMDHLNSDRVEIDMAFDMKATGTDLGVFFTTLVA